MVPTWFTRDHYDKFEDPVTLRIGSSSRPYRVSLSRVKSHSEVVQHKFGRGWRAFARYNNLMVGDSLIFEFRAVADFKVHIFHENGIRNAGVSSSHHPRTHCVGSGLSQGNRSDAYHRAACSSLQQRAANRTAGAADCLRIWNARRALEQREGVVFSSPSTLQNSSNSNVLQAPRPVRRIRKSFSHVPSLRKFH